MIGDECVREENSQRRSPREKGALFAKTSNTYLVCKTGELYRWSVVSLHNSQRVARKEARLISWRNLNGSSLAETSQ